MVVQMLPDGSEGFFCHFNKKPDTGVGKNCLDKNDCQKNEPCVGDLADHLSFVPKIHHISKIPGKHQACAAGDQ